MSGRHHAKRRTPQSAQSEPSGQFSPPSMVPLSESPQILSNARSCPRLFLQVFSQRPGRDGGGDGGWGGNGEGGGGEGGSEGGSEGGACGGNDGGAAGGCAGGVAGGDDGGSEGGLSGGGGGGGAAGGGRGGGGQGGGKGGCIGGDDGGGVNGGCGDGGGCEGGGGEGAGFTTKIKVGEATNVIFMPSEDDACATPPATSLSAAISTATLCCSEKRSTIAVARAEAASIVSKILVALTLST
eukprot:11294-Prymnesium_polylepis.2